MFFKRKSAWAIITPEETHKEIAMNDHKTGLLLNFEHSRPGMLDKEVEKLLSVE